MTLALNLFFWDEWLGIVTDDDDTTDGGGGGGGKKKGGKKRRLYTDDYPHLDQDFWDKREEYLRSLVKEVEPPVRIIEEDDDSIEEAIAKFNEERSALIIAIRSSPDLQTMKATGARLNELNAKITKLLGKKAVSALSK